MKGDNLSLRDKRPATINTIRMVVEQKQACRMFWPAKEKHKKCALILDFQTAWMVQRVYDAVSEENKLRMEKLIGTSATSFISMVDLLWQRTSNVPTENSEYKLRSLFHDRRLPSPRV